MKRSSILFLLAGSFTTQISAQKVWLDSGLKRVRREMAKHEINLKPNTDSTYKAMVHYDAGGILMEGIFVQWMDTYIEHGTFNFYHPNGALESTGRYERGVRVGIWKRFNEDGSSRSDRYYSEDGAATLRKVLGIDKS